MGPMFRYEKPQKGRYRQFHQVGVESFGFVGPDMEVEHILLMARFWHGLGLNEVVELQVNTLGGKESRHLYREALVQYFSKYKSELDEDSLRRLQTNPMRILDSKNPLLSKLIHDAPKCFDYINSDDKEHFEGFQQSLIDIGIPFEVNPYIVRGLDYYNRTVYEWTTPKLGSQNAVCAGGRYDSLVEQLGGEKTPAVGFAVGIERVVLLLENGLESQANGIDVYLISVGESASRLALLKAEELRDQSPSLRLLIHCGGGSFKTQFKRADKSGAKVALILGEDELAKQMFGVKFLREEREQTSVSFEEIGRFLGEYFNGSK
jgi:histidyl-tRNA synthetase